ncbi:MAG: hypothetical protein Q9M19_01350 [Mariprofundaceae bacterium]|nr:hypothetical protein [Mariprofundaceae bacterium]
MKTVNELQRLCDEAICLSKVLTISLEDFSGGNDQVGLIGIDTLLRILKKSVILHRDETRAASIAEAEGESNANPEEKTNGNIALEEKEHSTTATNQEKPSALSKYKTSELIAMQDDLRSQINEIDRELRERANKA